MSAVPNSAGGDFRNYRFRFLVITQCDMSLHFSRGKPPARGSGEGEGGSVAVGEGELTGWAGGGTTSTTGPAAGSCLATLSRGPAQRLLADLPLWVTNGLEHS